VAIGEYMSDECVFLIYYLSKAWTQGKHTYGPNILKFVIKCKLDDVYEEDFGVSFEKLKDVLLKMAPQLERDCIIAYDDVDFIIPQLQK
jgi:hypothetical protein